MSLDTFVRNVSGPTVVCRLRPVGRLLYSLEKKLQPPLPVALAPDAVE
jgi:hypothetical protein